jgi:hypothetical protein
MFKFERDEAMKSATKTVREKATLEETWKQTLAKKEAEMDSLIQK